MSQNSYSTNFVPKQSNLLFRNMSQNSQVPVLYQNSQILRKYFSKFIQYEFCTKLGYSFRNMSQNSFSTNFVPKQSYLSEICVKIHTVRILRQNSQILQKYVSEFIQYEFCTKIGSKICHETHKVRILYQVSQILQIYVSKFIQQE